MKHPSVPPPANEKLYRLVLLLALPVVIEQLLHSFVGITDTWLANRIVQTVGLAGEQLLQAEATNRAAAAAIGSVAYLLWMIGLVASAVGIGATALISRATGARHRSLARATVGQALLLACLLGTITAAAFFFGSAGIAQISGLEPSAQQYLERYAKIISLALPAAVIMFASASCLRGGGDTISPAIAVMVVDLVNVGVSVALVYGFLGLPKMGFDGIAIGTACGYVCGAVLMIALLLRKNSKARLILHRLRPDLAVLRRIIRIGMPAGVEMMIQWAANFGVLVIINQMGNVAASAHLIVVRIEALSYLTGLGFATAAATLVGQSLGKRDAARARRAGLLALAWGGAAMTFAGVIFILFSRQICGLLSIDEKVVESAALCLFIAAWSQPAFACAMIMGGALRGAGDTVRVLQINLASVVGVRLVSVLIVGYLGLGLAAVWVVLAVELGLRGTALLLRFIHGSWHTREV